MAKQRPPKEDLNDRELPLDSHVPSELHRIYRDGNTPLHFGTGTGFRFNDPGLKYGVCYLAYEPAGAFAETVLRDRAGAYFDETELADRLLVMTRARELLNRPVLWQRALEARHKRGIKQRTIYSLPTVVIRSVQPSHSARRSRLSGAAR